MALWKVTVCTPAVQVVILLLGKSSEQEQQEYNPTISTLCSESAFEMQQCFLPSYCPLQPLEIWAINYQWMTTCAVAFNLIFGLSFLMFLPIFFSSCFSFFFIFLAATQIFFFFFQSYGSHFWAVSPGQTYLPLLSYLMCNLLALTIPFILKNIALEKSVLKPSSSSDCFCL